MTSSKDVLRKEARRFRAQIDQTAEKPEDAAALFFEKINPGADNVLAGYWPKGREFDPTPIMQQFLQQGGRCVLPVVQGDRLLLRFAQWDEHTPLHQGAYGIAEPVTSGKTVWLEPDILLVPMLAFDRRGYRLGQGGGYYDTTLAHLRATKEILAVGVAYQQQACLFNLPVEEHDQKLDWIITPKEAKAFG